MGQQTSLVLKAGVTTTLNARASILAAANPLHVNLMFLILDKPKREDDERLAQHVTYKYEGLDVWARERNDTELRFLDNGHD
ncbi:uncharacterized protein MELLADRAFT_91889 [Melampsora larici-populina 98AG31]|uniref:MCM C-terminal AAA(+) ATPase domain-containing protein n=1 Tax=Melampsora larici-populina (strain 98AG31 / pathotype 3-4-7) TaxID=747676 RepID=F4S0Q9_MELLP|nr:uncharacterized protein MELLADRAFT_91889 [Melampsora larici-populina 98AG31]EGG01806.1 hypothetical protein MELLADRAFT_91889 [Melampsora larici-populina 98AG31]